MRRVARVFLIIVSILNGLAGLVCGLLLIVRPDGSFLQMGALVPVVKTLPLANIFFRDFLWLGVAMLLALGIPNLIAALMLVRRSERQYVATLVTGFLLVLWCSFEMIYMFNAPALGYFVVGVVSVLLVCPSVQASTEAKMQCRNHHGCVQTARFADLNGEPILLGNLCRLDRHVAPRLDQDEP